MQCGHHLRALAYSGSDPFYGIRTDIADRENAVAILGSFHKGGFVETALIAEDVLNEMSLGHRAAKDVVEHRVVAGVAFVVCFAASFWNSWLTRKRYIRSGTVKPVWLRKLLNAEAVG